MNLIIHDLDSREWEKIKSSCEGWNVVTDNGAMQPCRGCFSCWDRTPGTCVIKDGYENMAGIHLITEAEGFLSGFYEKYGFAREDRVMLMGREIKR